MRTPGVNNSPSPRTPQEPQNYDSLLTQIAQLNQDLHRTVALSQSLKEENQRLTHLNDTLERDVSTTEERLDMTEREFVNLSEAKIASDQRHETRVRDWKTQLESKIRAFAEMSKALGPPADLDELRSRIQDELEVPHQRRVASLESELGKVMAGFYRIRREYEVLKTSSEALALNQNTECQTLSGVYEVEVKAYQAQIAVLNAQLCHSQDAPSLQHSTTNNTLAQHNIRQQKIQVLEHECEALSQAKVQAVEALEREKSERVIEEQHLRSELTTARADLEQLERKHSLEELVQLRVEGKSGAETIQELREDQQRLKQQLQQKDQVLRDTHTNMQTRIMEHRAEYERERASFKENASRHQEKIAMLETAQASAEINVRKQLEQAQNQHQHRLADLTSQTQELTRVNETLERRVSQVSESLDVTSEELSRTKRLAETNDERWTARESSLKREHDALVLKCGQSQEVLNKMKLEFLGLRRRAKEVEGEYKVLQGAHREALALNESQQLEIEQFEIKCRSFEKDLAEQDFSSTGHNDRPESPVVEHYGHHHSSSSSSSSHDIALLMRKCSSYKMKLLDVHEENKKLKKKLGRQEKHFGRIEARQRREIATFVAQLEQESASSIVVHPVNTLDLKQEAELSQIRDTEATLDELLSLSQRVSQT